MNFLEPDSDRAVRVGVDAFYEGRLRPFVAADMIFETKNSRYRMKNGVIAAATDARLVGSEIVGWLVEEEEEGKSRIEPLWSHGARAVLLDRRFGRHIVVTSATLMLEIDGELVDGSDRRPLPPSKSSQPNMVAVKVPAAPPSGPVIPRPAGIPRWGAMAVAEAPESGPQSSAPISAPISAPLSSPIMPSTPPPRGVSTMPSTPPPASSGQPGKQRGTPPPPPGRTPSE